MPGKTELGHFLRSSGRKTRDFAQVFPQMAPSAWVSPRCGRIAPPSRQQRPSLEIEIRQAHEHEDLGGILGQALVTDLGITKLALDYPEQVLCCVPRDHIPPRSYALFEARSVLQAAFHDRKPEANP